MGRRWSRSAKHLDFIQYLEISRLSDPAVPSLPPSRMIDPTEDNTMPCVPSKVPEPEVLTSNLLPRTHWVKFLRRPKEN